MESASTLDTLQNTLRERTRIATDWKAQGKKVVGYRCMYVPEEIIYAADMLPYPLYGTPEAVSVADSYFQTCTCEFIRNIFDHALEGKLQFLDNLVLCNTCDVVRRLYDMWNGYIDTCSCYMINNPQMLCTEANHTYYREELDRFKKEMEKLSGNAITNEALQHAIDIHNETRGLLKDICMLRKQDNSPVSGTDMLHIVMASSVMPKDKVNPLLRQLLEEVKTRKAPERNGPRIMITGSIIDNPALIQLVEDVGGVVVADDLCTTTKYFWYQVEKADDPMDALYKFNNERCLCACMHPTESRLEYLLELIEEFKVDGVIYFNLKYCHPFLYEAPLFRDKLQARGIPTIFLEAGHDLSGLGQLQTRVQAFIEMLESE